MDHESDHKVTEGTGKAAKFDEKQFEKDLRAAVKGTPWRHKQGVIFRQIDDWFIAAHRWVHIEGDTRSVRADLIAKPMAIDSMLWRMIDLCENEEQPLSFRYWGYFVCGLPTVLSENLPHADPGQAARALVEITNDRLPQLMDRLAAEPFSAIARTSIGSHDNWRMDQTILFALLLEGDRAAARAEAEQQLVARKGGIEMSSLLKNPRIAGKKLTELVIEEIDGVHAPHEETPAPQMKNELSWLDRLLNRNR
jgi:hypothetical protein